ncbi:MAG TPA: hypothetical protein VF152_02645 [Acidimicrobiia bacterium]
MRGLLAAGAACVMAVGAAACGGDDGDDTPEVGIEAFCDEVSSYAEAGDFSDEATAEAYERMEDAAPDQIREDVTILRDALDGDVVGDERTAVAADRFTAYVAQACDIELVQGS